MPGRGTTRRGTADEETVVIHYEGGGKRPVNIALDSATAIIRDVARVVD